MALFDTDKNKIETTINGKKVYSIDEIKQLTSKIDIDMAGIGPFIPNPDTPLAQEKGGNLELSLKVMALMRLLLPKINIPATTAMEALHPEGRIMALKAGANVIMPNVTECEYKEKYLIYPGKVSLSTNAQETYKNVKIMIENLGRTISTDYGCSLNYKIR